MENEYWNPEDVRVTKYDPADYINTLEECALFLDEALKTGDAAFIASSLGVIARSKGMSEIARTSGLNRQGLYDALSGEKGCKLDTFLRVVRALGLGLSAHPMAARTAYRGAMSTDR